MAYIKLYEINEAKVMAHGDDALIKKYNTGIKKEMKAFYGEEQTAYYIRYIDESAQKTNNKNKWRDWNLVVRNAIREKWGNYNGQSLPKDEKKSSRNFDG